MPRTGRAVHGRIETPRDPRHGCLAPRPRAVGSPCPHRGSRGSSRREMRLPGGTAVQDAYRLLVFFVPKAMRRAHAWRAGWIGEIAHIRGAAVVPFLVRGVDASWWPLDVGGPVEARYVQDPAGREILRRPSTWRHPSPVSSAGSQMSTTTPRPASERMRRVPLWSPTIHWLIASPNPLPTGRVATLPSSCSVSWQCVRA